jgi:hypothetical protein
LVEARLLADFRRCDVPVQRMRPAIVALRKEFGHHPRAVARPFLDVDGRELVRIVQDEVGLDQNLRLVVVRNGQLVLTPIAARFQTLIDYQDRSAARVRPDGSTPSVVMDPARAFGQPAIRNVRTTHSRRTSAPAPVAPSWPTCTS